MGHEKVSAKILDHRDRQSLVASIKLECTYVYEHFTLKHRWKFLLQTLGRKGI